MIATRGAAPHPATPLSADTWLQHALSTAPADRPSAEAAIADLYARVRRPPPAFEWVDSPATAEILAPRPPCSVPADPGVLVENRLATSMADLRERLDRHLPDGRRIRGHSRAEPTLNSVWHNVAAPIGRAAPSGTGLRWYGQHDTPWIQHYEQVAQGTRFAEHLDVWVTLAKACGWWWPRDGICFVSERPQAVSVERTTETDVRLHSETGPAIEFRDGWRLHAWHGTVVPSWVVDNPHIDAIAAEANIEVRRCAIERIGWSAFLEAAELTPLGFSDDPGNPGFELVLYDMPRERWGADMNLLIAINGSVERDGTRRTYGLRVPSWFSNPIDAAGWTYGLAGTDYSTLQRRT